MNSTVLLQIFLYSGKYIKDKCETCEGSGKVEQPKEVKIDVPGINV